LNDAQVLPLQPIHEQPAVAMTIVNYFETNSGQDVA